MENISVFVNDEKVFDYDKGITFEDSQLAFLDTMDSDMDRGIKIQAELIANPDTRQRSTFVVMNLLKALQQGNDAAQTASCAYLNSRMPALVKVHANDYGEGINVEFIERH